VENLRNKQWVEANGHTPSIMDYARFNYVAQPEDHISEKGLFPRIGDYDKWAIEWGYKWLPQFSSAPAEKAYLSQLTTTKLKNKRLWFGPETIPYDPRLQSEDLGDNAMKANTYGIKNLKVIMQHLEEWTRTPNEGYEDLQTMYSSVLGQYIRYIMHVLRNVGGIYQTDKTVEQPGTLLENIPAATQHEAMVFLKDQLFEPPVWLFPKNISNNTGKRPTDVLINIQAQVLDKLIHGFMMERLVQNEEMDGKQAYKLSDLFADLKKGIWGELYSGQPLSLYRRNLQKLYVEKFNTMLNPKIKSGAGLTTAIDLDQLLPQGLAIRTSDTYAVISAQLKVLQADIKAAIPGAKDTITRYHWQYLANRITEVLEPKADNIY
jgi:hypothetical protein